MGSYDPQINSFIFKQFRQNVQDFYEVVEVSGSSLLIHTDSTGIITSSLFLTPAVTNTYDVIVFESGSFRSVPGPVGVGFYTNLTPVPQTLGGIQAGTTFNNVPLTAMFDALLYPYQVPSFSTFSLNESSPVEVGYTISAGSKTFTWTTTNSSNIVPNSVSIEDSTDSIILATGLANDGTENISISSIQYLTDSSHIWSIYAQDTHTGSLSKTYTVDWYWRIYYGEHVSGSLTDTDISSLRASDLSNTAAHTYAFIADIQKYKYITYPSSFGTLTTFKDTATLLNVAMSPMTVVSVTNYYGVVTNYNVYRSLNKLGGSINIQAS